MYTLDDIKEYMIKNFKDRPYTLEGKRMTRKQFETAWEKHVVNHGGAFRDLLYRHSDYPSLDEFAQAAQTDEAIMNDFEHLMTNAWFHVMDLH